MLSPSLKTMVMQHVFLNAFCKNPIFENDRSLIDFLIKDIIPHLRCPDDFIVKQDDDAAHFYYIVEGQCKVSIIDHKKQTIELPYTLVTGNYFGEIGLLFNCKRTATVKSVNYCNFARIDKTKFEETPQKLLDQLKFQSYNYRDGFKQFKMKMLKQVDYPETCTLDDRTMFYDEI